MTHDIIIINTYGKIQRRNLNIFDVHSSFIKAWIMYPTENMVISAHNNGYDVSYRFHTTQKLEYISQVFTL
jgi:hypothetical protein